MSIKHRSFKKHVENININTLNYKESVDALNAYTYHVMTVGILRLITNPDGMEEANEAILNSEDIARQWGKVQARLDDNPEMVLVSLSSVHDDLEDLHYTLEIDVAADPTELLNHLPPYELTRFAAVLKSVYFQLKDVLTSFNATLTMLKNYNSNFDGLEEQLDRSSNNLININDVSQEKVSGVRNEIASLKAEVDAISATKYSALGGTAGLVTVSGALIIGGALSLFTFIFACFAVFVGGVLTVISDSGLKAKKAEIENKSSICSDLEKDISAALVKLDSIQGFIDSYDSMIENLGTVTKAWSDLCEYLDATIKEVTGVQTDKDTVSDLYDLTEDLMNSVDDIKTTITNMTDDKAMFNMGIYEIGMTDTEVESIYNNSDSKYYGELFN